MWIGFDDTDSPRGGCTTWVLTEFLREARGYDVLGWPRLVRLNPNAPGKTRGNGALGVRLGHGRGTPWTIGEIAGEPVTAYSRGSPLTPREEEEIWETGLRVLHRESRWEDPRTDPALVACRTSLPPDLYWRAVREIVDPHAVWEFLAGVPSARVAAYRSGQGVVGASAVLSWPARRRTWELLAYRAPARWSEPRREVDPGSVREVARRFPETFHSYDPLTRRLLVTPHTPCPILLGLRARSPRRLPQALREIRSEPVDRWLLFATNQGTGDHWAPRVSTQALPGDAGWLHGWVASGPVSRPGGHVVFEVQDRGGIIPCVAFEATKTLPPVVRGLRVGDRVRVWGSFGSRPGGEGLSLRLERIQVIRTVPRTHKIANPVCRECGHRMGSLGRGKGFRCPICRGREPPESAPSREVGPRVLRGTYDPTPSARRHLAPPSLPAKGTGPARSPRPGRKDDVGTRGL